jgi:hypothetical protein
MMMFNDLDDNNAKLIKNMQKLISDSGDKKEQCPSNVENSHEKVNKINHGGFLDEPSIVNSILQDSGESKFARDIKQNESKNQVNLRSYDQAQYKTQPQNIQKDFNRRSSSKTYKSEYSGFDQYASDNRYEKKFDP